MQLRLQEHREDDRPPGVNPFSVSWHLPGLANSFVRHYRRITSWKNSLLRNYGQKSFWQNCATLPCLGRCHNEWEKRIFAKYTNFRRPSRDDVSAAAAALWWGNKVRTCFYRQLKGQNRPFRWREWANNYWGKDRHCHNLWLRLYFPQ